MGPITTVALAWLVVVSNVSFWTLVPPFRTPVGVARRGVRSRAPSICIVRPCAGAEPGLAAALLSSERLLKSPNVRLRIAVADVTDSAYGTLEAAAHELVRRGYDAQVVVTAAIGPNRKSDQLARALEHEPCDIVLVADSDVDLSNCDLGRLLDPLSDGVVAAWAPPIEVQPETFADRASAALLDSSMHAFALLGRLDRGALVGKVVAIERRALDAVGGFGALRAFLGEDMELSRRLRANGQRVFVAPIVAHSLARGRTSASVIVRYARWIRVIRTQRPWLLLSYPLFIAPAPLLLLLAGVGGLLEGGAGLSVATCVLVFRLLLGVLARKRSRSSRPMAHLPLDVILSDLLVLASVTCALATDRVEWRGRSLRFDKGGLLVHEDSG